jgi:hypothetical protein
MSVATAVIYEMDWWEPGVTRRCSRFEETFHVEVQQVVRNDVTKRSLLARFGDGEVEMSYQESVEGLDQSEDT